MPTSGQCQHKMGSRACRSLLLEVQLQVYPVLFCMPDKREDIKTMWSIRHFSISNQTGNKALHLLAVFLQAVFEFQLLVCLREVKKRFRKLPVHAIDKLRFYLPLQMVIITDIQIIPSYIIYMQVCSMQFHIKFPRAIEYVKQTFSLLCKSLHARPIQASGGNFCLDD